MYVIVVAQLKLKSNNSHRCFNSRFAVWVIVVVVFAGAGATIFNKSSTRLINIVTHKCTHKNKRTQKQLVESIN